MIALLSYSINLLASEHDTIPSTGRQDSVLIAYNDLRKVNSKLIELEYEREINSKYKKVISNDSVAISSLNSRIVCIDSIYTRKIRNIKKQRNVVGSVGIFSIILLIISIL